MTVASTRVLHDWHHDDIDKAKKEIFAALGDTDGFEVFGASVLVANYIRPVVTRGGIIAPGSAQHEDVFQGTVGMIVKIGPKAWDEQVIDRFNGRLPEVGDWVWFRPQDSIMASLKGPRSVMEKGTDGKRLRDFEGWPCSLILARDIHGRTKLPHIVV